MTTRFRFSAVRAVVASAGVLALLACGGNRPAEQPQATETTAPAESTGTAPAPSAPTETAAATPAPIPTEPPAAAAPAPKPAAPKPAAPKPKPAPEPPAPVVKTLVTGTQLSAELVDAASSKTSTVGQIVKARITEPVTLDGVAVVPAGSMLVGTITEAVPLKKIGGQASLGIRFDSLEVGDGAVPIAGSLVTKGKSETGKDAGTIAGATAGGALLGRLISKHDKTKGTLIGAAVGAAAGTGAAAATKGQEVELPAGTPFTMQLEAPVQVTVRL